MRIGIVLDPFGEKEPSGLGQAIQDLVRAIVQQKRGHELTLYVKKVPADIPSWVPKDVSLCALDTRSLFLAMPWKLRDQDVYVFLTPVVPLLFFSKNIAVVAHDFAYLDLSWQTPTSFFRSWALWCVHQASLLKASRIISVSQATRDALGRHFFVRGSARVIYNGFSAPAGSTPEAFDLPERYFLFAGVIKERKNVLGLVNAFAEFHKSNPEYHLVISGRNDSEYAERVRDRIADLVLTERVHLIGYRTSGELAYAYAHARALVFPSLIEGFGLPVLEAMSAHVPVITSKTGALGEVAGDAALLVDPLDVQELASALSRLAEDEQLAQELIRRGSERVKLFSWQKTADEYLDLLEHMCQPSRDA